MAWTTPPTFSSGAILTAAQLNILGDDLEHLNGIAIVPGYPFNGLQKDADLTASNNLWTIRNRHRYLLYKVRHLAGDITDLKIFIEGIEEADIVNSTLSAPQTFTGNIDLTGTTTNPSIGDIYRAYMTCTLVGGSVKIAVDYMHEFGATTF